MATTSNVGIEEVVASGPGLAFVVFPKALSLLPMAWLFSIFFFLTLLSLGIDSAFSLVEAINTVISDKFKKTSLKVIAFWVCLVAFLFGILFTTNAGLYFLDIVDHFITNFGLVIAGILECLAVGWILGADNLREFINSTSNWKIGRWWNFAIKFLIPVVLIILVVMQFITEINVNYEGYPLWALSIGWAVVIIPILMAICMATHPK